MKITNASTAYAKAYLNVFGDGLPRDSVVAIEQAGLFCKNIAGRFFY